MQLAINPNELSWPERSLSSALRRPTGLGRGWGLFQTLILGGLSFGTLPLLAWPIRVRDLFAGEAAQLIQICRFLADRDAKWPHHAGLMKAAQRTAPRAMLWILSTFAASFLMTAAVMLLCISDSGRGFDRLVEMTYQTGQSSNLDDPLALLQSFFGVWTVALIGGYLIHWMHVQLHYSAVRRFVTRFNVLLASSGIGPVVMPKRSVVPNLLWIVAGGIMTVGGAWWAVPMVLAASAQRRNAFQMHGELSRALADRVDVLAMTPTLPRSRCRTERCHAEIRTDARFCPRCGSTVNPVYAAGGVLA